jgi:large subunit ribosomal protein L24
MSSMVKMKIRKGDTVTVLSGKDKGKTGKVIKVMPKIGKVIVEDINTHTKFEKSKTAGKPGQQVKISSPLPVSKVMLLDSNSGRPSRVGYSFFGKRQETARCQRKR